MIKSSPSLTGLRVMKLALAMSFVLFACHKKSEQTQHVIDVSEEPNHQLVFENDLFQILDIRFMPGDTSLFHKHDRATLYTSLGWYGSAWQSPGTNWKSSAEQWPAGGIDFDDSYLKEPTVHRVTNIGRSSSRIIAVVHKGEGLTETPEVGGYELANSRFRVKRIRVGPNDTLRASTLPAVQLLIFPGENLLARSTETAPVPLTDNWLLLQPEDRLVNQGLQPIEVIVVEVLD